MAIEERSLTMVAQWAKSAQTKIPVPPVPGIAYRNTALDAANIEEGQAYDKAYDSARHNQLAYCTSGLVMGMEQYGILPWSPLTNYPEKGICMGPDGTLHQAVQPSGPANGGARPVSETEYWGKAIATTGSYELCEFYFFRSPVLRAGFQPAQGGLLENVPAMYPEAWAYLQTTEGRMLCKTEEEWQDMTTATWATLADGTKVGWNGIGGAPFYAPNWETGSLRLPDLRGMYAEAAGFDGLDVGGVHGDAIRNITGGVGQFVGTGGSSGAFVSQSLGAGSVVYQANTIFRVTFDPSRIVPTGNANKPRAYGVLPCVYLGTPK